MQDSISVLPNYRCKHAFPKHRIFFVVKWNLITWCSWYDASQRLWLQWYRRSRASLLGKQVIVFILWHYYGLAVKTGSIALLKFIYLFFIYFFIFCIIFLFLGRFFFTFTSKINLMGHARLHFALFRSHFCVKSIRLCQLLQLWTDFDEIFKRYSCKCRMIYL